MEKGIEVVTLLERTCTELAKRYSAKKIVLPNLAMRDVAVDWDGHAGSMVYREVELLQFDSAWVVGVGTSVGYPADLYAGDLLAISFSPGVLREGIAETIRKAIEQTDYFRKSLLIGFYAGQLGTSKTNPLSRKIDERLVRDKDSGDFVTQEAAYKMEVYLDGRPIVEQPVMYEPEFADYLANLIGTLLKEN